MNSLLNRLRAIFLSPDSKLELWLRTWYHKVAASKVFFRIQHWLAIRSYKKVREYQIEPPLPNISQFAKQPKVTFVLYPIQDNLDDVVTTLESIKNIHGEEWEVILISTHALFDLNLLPESVYDHRIRVYIPNKKNFFEIINGEYLVFCAAGDQFFNTLLSHFYEHLSKEPGPDLVYFDCEYFSEVKQEIKPFFKPQSPSPALLLSINYFSRGLFKYKTIEEKLSKINPGHDLRSLEYQLALWLCETGASITHIPSVLITQTSLSKPNNTTTRDVVQEHLTRQGLKHVSCREKPHGTRFTWDTGKPSIAIIIPTKNNHQLLHPLLTSIFQQENTQNYTIHVVDNGSQNQATLAYYEIIGQKPSVSVIPYPQQFNYSEAINLGVAKSTSDIVLLLNDDMEPIDSDWLPEMTQWALRPEVGVVGAKLLRANHTLQHAGIIMGLVGFVGHIYQNAPEDYFGLWGSANWYRDVLAVTGACQMMRREVFEQVGGYDEEFALAFGDIDFCLRVREQGYRNIYTPFARLFHYEGRSRGYQTPVGDILRGYEKFEEFLTHPDPYFNPNLTYSRIPICRNNPFSDGKREAQIRTRKQFYTSSS